MKCVWQTLLISSLYFINITAFADSNTMATLERLGVVAKELTYDGVFSYQSGNKLQSIRIIHHADNQVEIERLVSLNGVAREVIRTNDMVTCVYPEGQPVQENHRPLGRGFPTDLLQRLLAASDYYVISSGKQERVATHHTQALVMKPVDNYRYGYYLWVDKQNDLLLQADLVNELGDVLESFAFSSVEMGGSIPSELLQAQMHGNKMTWNRKEQAAKRTASPENKKVSPWQLTWLPQGFDLITQKNSFKLSDGASVEQRVYSDGLSSISVFFEKMRAQHGHLHGGSKRGVVNAFGTISQGHFITVVGEVPAITVEKVATSIFHINGK